MAKSSGNWIKNAIKNPGALHRALGVPQGTKIPADKMARAKHSNSAKIKREAILASTLSKFHK